MNDRIFLDSNIIIYAYDKSDPERQKKAQQILKEAFQNENGILSSQVLSEFFVVVTRKIKNPFSSEEAKIIISSLSFLQVEEVDLALVKRAIETHIQFKISYWDSLIVSTAERAGCATVFSEDLNHGQIIRCWLLDARCWIKKINSFSYQHPETSIQHRLAENVTQL